MGCAIGLLWDLWDRSIVHSVCALQRHHNGRDGVSNHQPHDCLLNRLFGRRSKKTSKLRVTGYVWGIHRRPVNSPHKWPVKLKMFPFDDVIMWIVMLCHCYVLDTLQCNFLGIDKPVIVPVSVLLSALYLIFRINRSLPQRMHLKISFGKWQPFCLDLNVLTRDLRVSKITLSICRDAARGRYCSASGTFRVVMIARRYDRILHV